MKPKLQEALKDEWAKVEAAQKEAVEGFEVVVSKVDCDPYLIL